MANLNKKYVEKTSIYVSFQEILDLRSACWYSTHNGSFLDPYLEDRINTLDSKLWVIQKNVFENE